MAEETFWYLASPYTKYPGGWHEAFEAAAYNAALLVDKGINIFSPITHSHPMAMRGEISPDNADAWKALDEPFVRLAHGLIILKLDGWDTSDGVTNEFTSFINRLLPIIYMTPGVIPPELLQKKTLP